ncbi:MAG: hypothetical protein LAN64_14805 [Acidobacteriia bacterium]|nr:hypothetical protein [Terriglobia bacterium]
MDSRDDPFEKRFAKEEDEASPREKTEIGRGHNPWKSRLKLLEEPEAALKKYSEEIDASELSLASKAIYLDHFTNFVRWVKGEFRPGSVKSPWLTRKQKPPTTPPIAES